MDNVIVHESASRGPDGTLYITEEIDRKTFQKWTLYFPRGDGRERWPTCHGAGHGCREYLPRNWVAITKPQL